jgi:glutamate 5-kinase
MAERWVIKIGSSLVTDEGRGLDHQAIMAWAHQIVTLREKGIDVVLVSSGAVAEGMSRMGWKKRPTSLHELQAAAAIGQMGLIQAYEAYFKNHSLHSAQVLLTHDDLADRKRYLNARTTLRTLLGLGVIPVVNENDTVATDEIRFGDNDTLAALVANLVEADTLIILTDIDGVYTGNPRRDPDAQLIPEAHAWDKRLDTYAGPSASILGSGGMSTKITAARRAARSGARTLIVSGREIDILVRLQQGEQIGTRLMPDKEPLAARKQWIAGQLKAKGELWLDDGAARVIREKGTSLLPVGVTRVEGKFMRGEVVCCRAPDGEEIARGLSNYSADEARKLAGHPSEQIRSLLGYEDEPELIHRDNLVIL